MSEIQGPEIFTDPDENPGTRQPASPEPLVSFDESVAADEEGAVLTLRLPEYDPEARAMFEIIASEKGAEEAWDEFNQNGINGSLTKLQLDFVKAYCRCWNAGQAALQVGVPERDHKRYGKQLLANPKIRDAIKRERRAILARHSLSTDEVISELTDIAFADPRDALEWGPDGLRVKSSSEIPESIARSIQAIEMVETKNGNSIKIKFYNKLDALGKLSNVLGLTKPEEISGQQVIINQIHVNPPKGMEEDMGSIIEGEAVEIHE